MPEKKCIYNFFEDLRQDMLTLQVMRIMDALWKNQDRDLCLSIYEVLPMGRNVIIAFFFAICRFKTQSYSVFEDEYFENCDHFVKRLLYSWLL